MKLLFDGYLWPKHIKPEDMAWDKAWVDNGPSTAGNKGFYLHVPYPAGGTVHRVYFITNESEEVGL